MSPYRFSPFSIEERSLLVKVRKDEFTRNFELESQRYILEVQRQLEKEKMSHGFRPTDRDLRARSVSPDYKVSNISNFDKFSEDSDGRINIDSEEEVDAKNIKSQLIDF